MKSKSLSKPFIGVIVLAVVAMLTWTLTTAVGASVKGGAEVFQEWRAQHVRLFWGIWAAEIVVVSLPVLWFIGRAMAKSQAAEEKQVAAARGVGSLVARALRGKGDAREKLVELLDHQEQVMRCQAARALSMLAEPETDKQLFQKVRYWSAGDKLALVETLRRSRDMRSAKLLEMLARDRSPAVARRARSALPMVAPRTTSMNEIVAIKRRQQDDRDRYEAARQAKRRRSPAAGAAARPPDQSVRPRRRSAPQDDGEN